MQTFEEQYPTPVGHIHLLAHRGDLIVHPWNDAPQVEDEPVFGYLDFSGIEVLHEQKEKNLIVNQASVLIATRMAPGNLGTAGIAYLAVGTGVGTGTTDSPQAEDPAYRQLRIELARKAITSWTYLDGSGAPIGSPPNGIGRVQYTTTFSPTEAIGALVEMGLVGGPASVTVNSGHLFNYKVFKAWNKTLEINAALTIVWSITY